MQLVYSDLKSLVNTSHIYLPYDFIFGKLVQDKKIKRLSGGVISDSSSFQYIGTDLESDILACRDKPFYIVSAHNYNLPSTWFKFHSLIGDLSQQCTEDIFIHLPYYNLDAARHFRNIQNKKITKTIMANSPELHHVHLRSEATNALIEFRNNGFRCQYSRKGSHAKAYIFDNQVAIVGSFNFTSQAMYKNNELGLLIFGDEVKRLKKFLQENALAR